MPTLNPEQAKYNRAISKARNGCIRSLYSFLKFFWPVVEKEPFVPNWHIKYICDEIQEAVERVINRESRVHDIVINVPPGSSKSTICSVMLPAWVWIHDPTIRILSGSHAFDLSTHLAIKSRDVIKSEDFERLFPGLIRFKIDKNGKTAFDNTETGGRKVATVGSTFIGFHGHLIIVDDGQDPESAFSEVKTKGVHDWIDNLSTRMVDKAVTLTIYIQQRLSCDDITEYVLEKGSCLHICLPSEITDLANVNPPELAKNYTDNLLDPNRLGSETIKKAKAKLGSRKYAQQFLQHPSAAEGTIFKRQYWKYYKEIPRGYVIRIVQSWDCALKAKETSDFWCCTTWMEKAEGYFLIDFFMEKMESPEGKAAIITMNAKHKPHNVLIEDKSSGSVLIQELQAETKINIVPVQVPIDKVSRANDAVPTIEAGNVYLPLEAPYTQGLVDRLALFPDGKHDDDVDSVTQFLNWSRAGAVAFPTVVTGKAKRPAGW